MLYLLFFFHIFLPDNQKLSGFFIKIILIEKQIVSNFTQKKQTKKFVENKQNSTFTL